MVKVTTFPKLCPKCDKPLEVEKKLSGSWWYYCKDSREVIKCWPPFARFRVPMEQWILDLLKGPNEGVGIIR